MHNSRQPDGCYENFRADLDTFMLNISNNWMGEWLKHSCSLILFELNF